MSEEQIVQTAVKPGFELVPPEPVAAVPVESASGMVKLEAKTVDALDKQAAEFVDEILALSGQSADFKDRVDAIHRLGTAEIKASSQVSNRMLERPVKAMKNGLFDEGSAISRGLIDLRNTVEDLDPSRQGDLFKPRKILGLFSWGNKLVDYFQSYQSAQTHLNSIIESLYHGQDELKRDNAAIEQEKANLWNLMQKLEQYVHLGKKLDARLEEKVFQVEASDPEKARVMREEVLFYLRQKVTDLLTQLSVNIQGYLALDMIRKNNLELIKGVDRATTTTVSALRTAVMVAQALANQKLVLDQISALNTTTGNMIESTASMLKNQSAAIHQQASSATVNIDQLKNAFANIYQTMDMIADYKIKALDNMQKTVNVLSQEVDKAKGYVERARKAEGVAAELGLPADDDGVVSLK